MNLHISPCPNDTFMFDAMVHGRVDTEGLVFDLHFADIEELNHNAIHDRAEVTKLSYAVWPIVADKYRLLTSGSALGRGNGPLLVSLKPLSKNDLRGIKVAVPGKYTTANMLLQTIFPEVGRVEEYLFSDIAEAVLSGRADAGLLIHEGRFLYRERGLSLVADMGQEWEERYGLPLPLGAIAVSRRVAEEVAGKIDRVLRRSIEYAFANPQASRAFVKRHARELDDRVIKSHIDLFVNMYSLDVGDEGRAAVKLLTGKDFFGN